MKIKPLADRVIIKPAAAEERTKGGIILPDTAKEKPVVGEIVAVGPGKVSDDGKKIVMEVKLVTRCSMGSTPEQKSPTKAKST